ncbi:B-cell receptor-associated protein 31 isoform X2 [Columba livia]|uniref:B-cell receptor-associated protein 31 isoform X2 n=1 Tax=Columba livia TaxID=8932 RepID=UPI0031BB32D0
MSLQWTVVATFLYAEVFLVLLLCVPFVSAARWQRIFRSRLVGLAVARGNTAFLVLIAVLVLLLLDALRETQRYGAPERPAPRGPGASEHVHMKLFRAQRNLYVAGFSLLLAFLVRRLVTLISQQAVLGAASEAFRKQAEGASRAARRYMEDNDALRKLQDGGGDSAAPSPEENESLKAKVEKLKEELAASKRTLEKAGERGAGHAAPGRGADARVRPAAGAARAPAGSTRWAPGQERGVRPGPAPPDKPHPADQAPPDKPRPADQALPPDKPRPADQAPPPGQATPSRPGPTPAPPASGQWAGFGTGWFWGPSQPPPRPEVGGPPALGGGGAEPLFWGAETPCSPHLPFQ